MNKTEMKQNLSEALAVLQVNDLASISLADRMAAMQEEVENFKARILMVGQFSAGKTALLNAMLGGEEILKEDINPETALATELVYG
ncbi:MAG: dynamin family protein, partial [Selenomonas sp.]